MTELLPEMESRAVSAIETANAELIRTGEMEARSLTQLLDVQRSRINRVASEFDPNQFSLPGIAEVERRQMEADRRHWTYRLTRLDDELQTEPARVRDFYTVRAHRLEPVGLVYLWPITG